MNDEEKKQITYLFDCPKTSISRQEAQQKCLTIRHRLHDFHFIFTDGSRVSHIPHFSGIRQAISETRKRGAHVRTCSCAPPSTCEKAWLMGIPNTKPHTKFQHNPSLRFRVTEKGAHLHVRTCARTDLPPTPRPDPRPEQYQSLLGL